MQEFGVECTFQGHYNEPKVNLKVPLEIVQALGTVQFNMVYHVASGRFEKVEMIDTDGQVIGDATFTTTAVASAPAPAATAARRASPAARNTSVNRSAAPKSNNVPKSRPVAANH